MVSGRRRARVMLVVPLLGLLLGVLPAALPAAAPASYVVTIKADDMSDANCTATRCTLLIHWSDRRPSENGGSAIA